MTRAWLLDVLDRELPNMLGHDRDRIAALILAALPQDAIAAAIVESLADTLDLGPYGTVPGPQSIARAIGAAASAAVIRALGGPS